MAATTLRIHTCSSSLFPSTVLFGPGPVYLDEQKGKYGITGEPLQIIQQAQLTEPALVIVKNVDDWSQFATLFVANSPSIDGPIVYAIDWGSELNERVKKQFKDRTCWELIEKKLIPCNK